MATLGPQAVVPVGWNKDFQLAKTVSGGHLWWATHKALEETVFPLCLTLETDKCSQ